MASIAGRSTVSSLLGPKMGSGLMGPQQLALMRDLTRKKEAEEVQEAWLKRHSVILLNEVEMDQALDEEFGTMDEIVKENARPLLVWCNKRPGVMVMKDEDVIEIACNDCSASDVPGLDPKDFCLHSGLKDKGRWKDAIFVDGRQGVSPDDNGEDAVVIRSEWVAILDRLSVPKPGELPKLGAWILSRASGDNATSTAEAPSSRKQRSKKRTKLQADHHEDAAAAVSSADLPGPVFKTGFVDPDYQDLSSRINATLMAANAVQLLPATASTV